MQSHEDFFQRGLSVFAKDSDEYQADEIADVAELLMSEIAQFITGAGFLIDGGATAAYFYGKLRPQN